MATPPALRCENLFKRYGQQRVLEGIDFTVERGGIHGLVGLNGAGKTTTLECLLGLKSFDSGHISILEFTPQTLYSARGKVSVVFDSPCLHPQLTVRQTLDYARLHNRSSSLDTQEVETLLGIEPYRHVKIRHLSLGNRRRTSIAQALINHPQLVVLDEPFNGLDAGGVEDVLALIQRLNQEQHTSFLLASHQLSYLENICTHLSILHQGRALLNQSIDTLLQNDKSIVSIHTGNNRQTRIVLSQLSGVKLLPQEALDSAGIRCHLVGMNSAQLNKKLIELGIDVEQLIVRKPSLASVFNATIGKIQ